MFESRSCGSGSNQAGLTKAEWCERHRARHDVCGRAGGVECGLGQQPLSLRAADFPLTSGGTLRPPLGHRSATQFRFASPVRRLPPPRRRSVSESVPSARIISSSGISMSSSAELNDLPCASSARVRVTPPSAIPCRTKFSAPMDGSSYRRTSPVTRPANRSRTRAAVTCRARRG